MRKCKYTTPIRVFSLHFGRGWWWGRYFYFFKPFAIVPMAKHHNWTDLPPEWYDLKHSWDLWKI